MHSYETLIMPAMYLAPVGVYAAIARSSKIQVETHENFVKQTTRSRCEIYGANGKQLLSIPVEKRGNHIPVTEVCISYKVDWQKIHWRSLVSAYRNSPYFEYYAHEFEPFFIQKTELIYNFNIALHNTVIKLLKMKSSYTFTAGYVAEYDATVLDLRKENAVLPDVAAYSQVFEERYGFIPNLSILDLLFNAGPDSLKILTGE